MISILDNTNQLEDYVGAIEMDDKEVEVLRGHEFEVSLVQPTVKETVQCMTLQEFNYEHLVIPRKPAWTRSMTKEDVDRNEKDAFLQWRRSIAELEGGATGLVGRRVTPFEKNLEVWRQLWRVIERCDICIQILDARNPLVYYTEDLVKYAAEQDPPRPVLLILNKADYLTDMQRNAWSRYFLKRKIMFVFYSAHFAQTEVDNLAHELSVAGLLDGAVEPRALRAEEKEEINRLAKDLVQGWGQAGGVEDEAGSRVDEDDAAVLSGDVVWGDGTVDTKCGANKQGRVQDQDDEDDAGGSFVVESAQLERQGRVLTRSELLHVLVQVCSDFGIEAQGRHDGRVCVGMVGYPNVGKSSVINSLLGVAKSSHGIVRVAVSSTPGKTKHFQTIMVNDRLMLCDCPGLVFPSFMRSTGEMLCSGILPINQMREYVEPCEVITSRVPRHHLEAIYSMPIVRQLDFKDAADRPPTSSEFLGAYCKLKTYIATASGRWDEFKGCKEVLRDYNDGRILHVCPPPSSAAAQSSHDGAALKQWHRETEKILMKNDKVRERLEAHRLRELDAEGASESGAAAEDSVFVFGDVGQELEFVAGDGADEEYEYVAEEEEGARDVETLSTAGKGSPGKEKRDHKKKQKWGKKGKKLRDKDPYSEMNGPQSFVAYSTNRTHATHFGAAASSSTSKSNEAAGGKKVRNDAAVAYGTPFTR